MRANSGVPRTGAGSGASGLATGSEPSAFAGADGGHAGCSGAPQFQSAPAGDAATAKPTAQAATLKLATCLRHARITGAKPTRSI